jgi:hypothetical protein
MHSLSFLSTLSPLRFHCTNGARLVSMLHWLPLSFTHLRAKCILSNNAEIFDSWLQKRCIFSIGAIRHVRGV